MLRGPMFGAGSVQAQEHLGFEGRGGGSRKSGRKTDPKPRNESFIPSPKAENPKSLGRLWKSNPKPKTFQIDVNASPSERTVNELSTCSWMQGFGLSIGKPCSVYEL